MALILDGPRMAPARGGKPEGLVVLLHGYGSNGADLINLAPYWAKAMPAAAFAAPNAPEPVPQAPGGFQWFPLAELDPHLMEIGARQAAASLDWFLDRELERFGVSADRLALVGFSQGAMMALHVGLRRKTAPAAILAYSGALVGARRLKEEVKSAPPILLVHGDQDPVVPVTAMFDAAESLAAAGLSAQWHVSYNLPHAIGPDGLELGGAFLKKFLDVRALAGAS